MNDQRIERALRDGPADEPVYVPGSYKGASGPPWMLALASGTVAAALIIGLVVGIGMNLVRDPTGTGPDGSVDPAALRAELLGTWTTDAITRDAWERGLVARGYDADDIDAFLIREPFDTDFRYRLEFRRSGLTIASSRDGAPFVGNSAGLWSILDDGSLSFSDIPFGGPGPGADCRVTARFSIVGDRLAFEPTATTGCGLEERMANTAFFNLAPYARGD